MGITIIIIIIIIYPPIAQPQQQKQQQQRQLISHQRGLMLNALQCALRIIVHIVLFMGGERRHFFSNVSSQWCPGWNRDRYMGFLAFLYILVICFIYKLVSLKQNKTWLPKCAIASSDIPGSITIQDHNM